MVSWPGSNYTASTKSINHEKAFLFLQWDQHTDQRLQQLETVLDTNALAL